MTCVVLQSTETKTPQYIIGHKLNEKRLGTQCCVIDTCSDEVPCDVWLTPVTPMRSCVLCDWHLLFRQGLVSCVIGTCHSDEVSCAVWLTPVTPMRSRVLCDWHMLWWGLVCCLIDTCSVQVLCAVWLTHALMRSCLLSLRWALMWDVFHNAGLIIDAFGELRDQQEQVREDMEVILFRYSPMYHRLKTQLCLYALMFALGPGLYVCLTCCSFLQTKCFICGIGSDYFDTTPHGFETHTLEEHNLANYMWVAPQNEPQNSQGRALHLVLLAMRHTEEIHGHLFLAVVPKHQSADHHWSLTKCLPIPSNDS